MSQVSCQGRSSTLGRLFPSSPFFWLCLWFLLLAFPFYASAEGPGIKFLGGQGSFHPRLLLAGGFDRNPLNRSDDSRVSTPALSGVPSSFYLAIRPGLGLKIETDSIGFDLQGYANYSYFFASEAASLNQLTGKADLTLEFFRSSIVKLTVGNYFGRNAGDSLSAADVFNNILFFYDPGTQRGGAFLSLDNRTKLGLTFQPKGGAFTADLEYQFQFGFYPNPDLDNQRHYIALNAKWKFFPRTALTFDSSVKLVNFSPQFNLSRASQTNRNSNPFKAYVGLVGQFTDRISFVIRLGGGYSFSDGGTRSPTGLPKDSYGMLIGDLSMEYRFNPTTYFRLGFRHDFDYSLFTNFYHETLGFAEFSSQFYRFLVRAGFDFGYVQYGEILRNVGDISFTYKRAPTASNANATIPNNFLIRAKTSFDWYIFDWWTLGVAVAFEWREPNGSVLYQAEGNNFSFGYWKINAMLRTELAF